LFASHHVAHLTFTQPHCLPERDAAKAEAYFERALAVAREQQAKSWELRSAMSIARLWRDQGKRNTKALLLQPGATTHAMSLSLFSALMQNISKFSQQYVEQQEAPL
jgi:predicted ATPase